MRGWLADGALDWLWPPPSAPACRSRSSRRTRCRKSAGSPTPWAAGGGNTTLKDDAAMEHMPELIKLARHPNVAVKATGAPGYCSGPYPFRSMHLYLRQIYDAFGCSWAPT